MLGIKDKLNTKEYFGVNKVEFLETAVAYIKEALIHFDSYYEEEHYLCYIMKYHVCNFNNLEHYRVCKIIISCINEIIEQKHTVSNWLGVYVCSDIVKLYRKSILKLLLQEFKKALEEVKGEV